VDVAEVTEQAMDPGNNYQRMRSRTLTLGDEDEGRVVWAGSGLNEEEEEEKASS